MERHGKCHSSGFHRHDLRARVHMAGRHFAVAASGDERERGVRFRHGDGGSAIPIAGPLPLVSVVTMYARGELVDMRPDCSSLAPAAEQGGEASG